MNVWIIMATDYTPYGKPLKHPEPQAVFEDLDTAEKFLERWRNSSVNRHKKLWLECKKFYKKEDPNAVR